MLKTLTVQNYALIDELQLGFGKALNIITGETGAGKSVLLGALGLLLGDRTDTSALLDKTKKCVIEGVFQSTQKIKLFLENAELDADDEVIIHREINKDGKSRAFVNDTPVNLSLLKELGQELVDIHSQHETLLLNNMNFQLSVVDAFAGNQDKLAEYKAAYKNYRQLIAVLSNLVEEERKSSTEQDYLQFQFNELEEASLQPGEQKLLEDELSSLTHSGEIIQAINQFTNSVSEEESNLLAGLSGTMNLISGLSKYTAQFENASQRLKALVIELKDIQDEINHSAASVTSDPARQELLSNRLDTIYRLQQKHRVSTTDELISLKDSISEKLLNFTSLGNKIESVRKDVEAAYNNVRSIATALSLARQEAVPAIESKIKLLLKEVAMPDAVLKIDITTLPENELNSTGLDKIRFLFSANKGIMYADISKVASGGELSRLMLCIKASVAKLIDLPTIVFDEIDTGVSGETAMRIGKVMTDLSKNRQLLAITHLPQIAGRGEDHFFVYKEVRAKKTFTRVKKLNEDERVVELAKMLGGDRPTTVAMENARELLK